MSFLFSVVERGGRENVLADSYEGARKAVRARYRHGIVSGALAVKSKTYKRKAKEFYGMVKVGTDQYLHVHGGVILNCYVGSYQRISASAH